MTDISWPWATGTGADASEDRWYEEAQYFLGPGVIRSLATDFPDDLSDNLQVFADSTGLQVKVKKGRGWIGHLFRADAQTTLPIAANVSGQPRVDLVVLRMDRSLTDNQMFRTTITGTPAVSPVAPPPVRTNTVYDVPLATVAVANGAATIAAGNVTDARVYAIVPRRFQVTAATVDTGGNIISSVNVASVIDAGAGLLSVIPQNAYAIAPTVTVSAQSDGAMEATVSSASPPTTTAFSVRVFNSSFVVADPTRFHVIAVGTPAT